MAQTNLRHLLHQYKVWDEIKFLLPTEAADWEISIDDKHLQHALDAQAQHHVQHLEDMPILIAYAYDKMHHALHPIIKISWMVNLTELCLRWSATLLIADIVAQQQDLTLPSWSQKILRYHIERPTLGSWVHIIRELSKQGKQGKHKKKKTGLWTLHDRIKSHFGKYKEGDADTLLSIRNRFAHDGITADNAHTAWTAIEEDIEDLVSQVIQATHQGIEGEKNCRVFAIHEQQIYSLMGLEGEQGLTPITEQNFQNMLTLQNLPSPFDHLNSAEDAVYLVSENTGEVRLLPYFILFGRTEPDPTLNPVVQVYAKFDNKKAVFTPISSSKTVTYLEDIHLFEHFLGLNHKSTLSLLDGYTCEDYLLDHSESFKEKLFGRELELDLITHWLFQSTTDLSHNASSAVDGVGKINKKNKVAQSFIPQIAWFGGKSGMGKSHLLSTLAYQIHTQTHRQSRPNLFTVFSAFQKENNQLPECPVFYHRFELEDRRCSLDFCLRLFAQKLHQVFALQLHGHEERFHSLHYREKYGHELEAYLEDLLLFLTPLSTKNATIDTDFIVILDSVDLLNVQAQESIKTTEMSPVTKLLDVLAKLISVSTLHIRIIMSTSTNKPPHMSMQSIPTLLLAQTHILYTRISQQGQQYPGARIKCERELAYLDLLQNGMLPALTDRSIRQMLVEASGNAYSAAINELGKDKNNIQDNPFLHAVIKASGGSPLYLHLVLEELEWGRLHISASPQLPNGVEAYFFNMLQRVDFGDGTRNLPLALCLLLIARQELSTLAIAQLVFKKSNPSSSEIEQMNALLNQMTHIFTKHTHDEQSYWHFQDQSLKAVLQANSQMGPPQLTLTHRESLERFTHFCDLWQTTAHHSHFRQGGLFSHLMQFDVDYVLQLNTSKVLRELITRFTQVEYLMMYADHNGPEKMLNLSYLYMQLQQKASQKKLKLSPKIQSLLQDWTRFFRQNQSILSRTHTSIQPSQVLLQLVLDDAIQSPISKQAQKWVTRHPEVLQTLRLIPKSRKESSLSSLLCYAQQFNGSIQSITAIAPDLFLCVCGTTKSSSEIMIYAVQRSRALWKRTVVDQPKSVQVFVLQKTQHAVTHTSNLAYTTCQIAVCTSSGIDLVQLHMSTTQCNEIPLDHNVPHSLRHTEEKILKLKACTQMSPQCMIAWETRKVYVWDWSQGEVKHFTFDVSSYPRDLIVLSACEVIIHQGKKIEYLSWNLSDLTHTQTLLITLDKTYKYGALYKVQDHQYLLISAQTKTKESPRIDWVFFVNTVVHHEADHNELDHKESENLNHTSSIVHQTLTHPHTSWVFTVLVAPTRSNQTTHFYLSSQSHITRWQWPKTTQVTDIPSYPTFQTIFTATSISRPSLTTQDTEGMSDVFEELSGGIWVGQTPIWFGRYGLILVWYRERQWMRIDLNHPDAHSSGINQLQALSDHLFISASDDNDLRLWSFDTRSKITCKGLWRGHNDRIKQAIVLEGSSQDKYLISNSINKEIRVWSMDRSLLRKALNQSRKTIRDPFISHAILMHDYVIAGHQTLVLTLWSEYGAHRVKETQILSSDPKESAISHIYPLFNIQQDRSQDDSKRVQDKVEGSLAPHHHTTHTHAIMSDHILIITQKSTQSYVYTFPQLNQVHCLDYPAYLSSHLMVGDQMNSFFLTTFESNKNKKELTY